MNAPPGPHVKPHLLPITGGGAHPYGGIHPSVMGKGDFAGVTVYARQVAEDSRNIRNEICMQKGLSRNNSKKENFLLRTLRKLSRLLKVSK